MRGALNEADCRHGGHALGGTFIETRGAARQRSEPTADYYPLIMRAVGRLEPNTAQARRKIYDRARTAMLAQLRSVIPSIAESDIGREQLALESAIRQIETESILNFDPPMQPSMELSSPPLLLTRDTSLTRHIPT
jgi:hypothetical protein